MQQLLRGMIGLYGRQLKFEKISSAAVAPAAAAPVSGAPPATDTLAVGAIAAFPGVVGLRVEEAPAGGAATAAVSATVAAAAAISASHARYAGDLPTTLAVAKEDAAPKETARVQRLPPGLFGGVGSVGGIGGDCSAEDGGTASGGIIPTPAVATADTAPYGTATVRRLPPGLLVADSGGASLPTPNPAATAAAITTATASATTVITATRGSGGGGDCDGDEGVCVTPSTVSWVGGQRTSCSPRLAKDGGWGEGGGGDGEVGRLGEREGPACGGGGETTSRPRPASEGGWGGGGNGGGGEWGGGAETSWSPRSARDGGWGEEGGDGCGEEGGVWDGGQGASYSPRHARAAAIAPDRRRHHHHHYHHHQETTANGNAAPSTRHAAAQTSTSSQNHLAAWKTPKDSGYGSGYHRRGSGSCSGSSGSLGGCSHSSSSVGGGGGTGGSDGNGGVVSFHRRNKRRTRGKTSPRSGDNSRHYKKSAFRETGASRRPAHHGDMAPAPSVARACPRVAAGGGGNFRGSDGGDGVNVSGNGWRGDARYLPAAPSAARQVECTNSGRCGPYVRYQLPVAACGSFASQATTVGAVTHYPRHAGHGVHAGCGRQTGHCGHGWYGGPAWHANRAGHANRVRR